MGSVAPALAPGLEWTAAERAAKTPSSEAAASKEMFLRLLVTQIRNQNPLEPMEGIEFLSQLAEFSALEQMVAIREEIAALRAALVGGAASEANSA